MCIFPDNFKKMWYSWELEDAKRENNHRSTMAGTCHSSLVFTYISLQVLAYGYMQLGMAIGGDKKKVSLTFCCQRFVTWCAVLGYKGPRACWHRQEELYSWDAEVHLHRRPFLEAAMNIIGTFVFRQSVCTDVLGSRNVLPEFR